MSLCSYELQEVLEKLAKERFARDVKAGRIDVEIKEGKTTVSWKDYANKLSDNLPHTYDTKPLWFN